jgi:hypothetical protein
MEYPTMFPNAAAMPVGAGNPGPGLLDGIDNSINVPPSWVSPQSMYSSYSDTFSYEFVAHRAQRQYIHWHPLS